MALGAQRRRGYVVTKAGWTRENLRHGAAMLRYGRHPAATVYDSIGEDFFMALAPGWLNLGLWEGDGSDPAEAAIAVRRLVRTIATRYRTAATCSISGTASRSRIH